ncbi:type II secretion system minor pseudopilin GspK [Paraburkholderia jirisanensis]
MQRDTTLHRKRGPAAKRREGGIAIVTALLVVALAATLAASVVWREMVSIRDVENQRLAVETQWVERAAVQWARATLHAEAAVSNVTYVGQPWSEKVNDAQLADFLPRDVAATNAELANAWISGEVEDAQARFNLSDLVSRPGPHAPWQVNPDGLIAYRQLLSSVSLSPALAQATADYMLHSLTETRGDANWPLQLVTPDDLIRVPGYDHDAIHALAPFITILPDYTYVNANTASETVLAASIPTVSAELAHRLVERRATAWFNSITDVALVLSPLGLNASLPAGSIVAVTSGYFIVHCRIHSARINARLDTLIARYGIGDFSWTSVIWVHRLAA